MRKIKVLHIAQIDNDVTKGTSVIVPQYITEQRQNLKLEVSFVNCNKNSISTLKNIRNVVTADSINVISKHIKRFEPDIVVFHELYKPVYLKIYKILLQMKIPYIIIPHGSLTIEAQSKKRVKKTVANILLFNKFFRLASKIQYLSEKEKDNTKYKKLDSCVIGNGISEVPDENLYLKKHGSAIKAKKFTLLYVGRYDYIIKGLDQLIEAMLLIIKNNNQKNIKLELYGKGNLRDYNTIKNYIISNDLENYISLNGPIFGDEKRKIIVEADAFVQVSRTEGQPLGVMEAMCLGMPVILSKGTGYESVINEKKVGLLTSTNSKEIASAILEMYYNRDKLNEYSRNSYCFAIENYSWSKIVKKTVEFYTNITKK